jgi:hypothetical protein
MVVAEAGVRCASSACDLAYLNSAKHLGGDPPPVDVRGLIANMPWQVPLEPMHPAGRGCI